MSKTLTLLPLLVVAAASPARAQDAPQAPEAAPASVASEATPPAPPAPGGAADAPAPGPAAAVDERLVALEGKADGQAESAAEVKAEVDKLKKIKVSGYIQGRAEWHDDAVLGLNAAGKPSETRQFLVRRARIKTIYEGHDAEFMLQADFAGGAPTLKDAEATWIEPFTGLGIRFTVGQFKWPFGYEILQSSGEREMPERTRVIRVLFPGERDRGFRIQARKDWFRFAGAVVNGNGTQDAIYGTNDQSSFKDLTARVGGDFGQFVMGLSGYWGHTLKTTPGAAGKVSGKDGDGDGVIRGDEITYTPPTATDYQRFSRLRLGADAQGYVDVPGLGGLALKGETVWSRDKNLAFNGTAADAAKDLTSWGWWALAVQNVGDHVAALVRIDQWEPNTSKPNDKMTTTAFGALAHLSGNAKLALVYEHVVSEVASGMTDPADDVFTAQLQGKF